MLNRKKAARPRRITHSSAVTWLNGRQAVVTQVDGNGRISNLTVDRGCSTEQGFLADVVSAIGDQDRLMILGPTSTRLALERAYVNVYHRPDRLVDVEPAGQVDPDAMADQARTLAG
jgi:hypothetical protein